MSIAQTGEPVLLDSDSVEQGEAKGRGRLAAQMFIDGKVETLQEAADQFSISRQAVHQAKERMSTEPAKIAEQVDIPSWITHSHDRADFRKLSAKSQSAVAAREIKLNRACVQEGIRPAPVRLTPLEQAQKSFRKLTKPDRDAFDLWRAEQPQKSKPPGHRPALNRVE